MKWYGIWLDNGWETGWVITERAGFLTTCNTLEKCEEYIKTNQQVNHIGKELLVIKQHTFDECEDESYNCCFGIELPNECSKDELEYLIEVLEL